MSGGSNDSRSRRGAARFASRRWSVLGLALLLGCAASGTPGQGTGASSGASTGGSGGAGRFAAAAGAASGVGGAGNAQGLSRLELEPEVIADGWVEPSNPRIHYFGRWHWADPERPTASWGPVGVRLRFEGSNIGIRLEDERIDLGAEGTGNVYQYRIDSGDFTLLGATSEQRYELASDLPEGAHELELVRRTESKFGTTSILGFELEPGARLLDPGAPPARKLEVFGDSISAGLANENTGWYTNATQNGYLAFGPVLARRLDAEWHVEARGGGTFYSDTWLPMPPFFDKAFGPGNVSHAPPQAAPLWDFERWQPDVFILALGTNDFSEQYPHIDQDLYVKKYVGFLLTLRELYPTAEIFCLAPFKEGAPWDEARLYIPMAVEDTGDPRIHAVDPVGDGASESWLGSGDFVSGDPFHPNLQGHRKIAERLEVIVRRDLSW